MFMFILLYGTHLFIIATLAFAYRLYAKPNKNVVLETTLADKYLAEPQVISIITTYQKQLNQLCLFLVLLGLPLVVIRYDSIAILYFFFLMIVAFGGAHYLLISHIRNMQVLKMTKKWFSGTSSEQTLRIDTDLSQSKNQKILSPFWFLPPFGFQISLLLVALIYRLDWHFTWLISGIFLLILLLSFLTYRAIYRIPAKVLTEDPKVNRYCNDLAKRSWSLTLVLTAYFLTLMQGSLFLAGFVSSSAFFWLTWVIIIASLALVVGTFYLLMDSRRKQNLALSQTKKYYYSEADQHWRYGMYINPNDSRVLVQDRIGLNMSLNLGHKHAKAIITGILVPVLILLVWLSTMMLQADFSKHTFTMDFAKESVIMKAPFAKTANVPYKTITKVELLDEQPEALRVAGAATSHYATGQFNVTGEKKTAEFYIDKRSEKIIKLTTKNQNYYFTSRTTKETLLKYDELKEKMN